MKLLRLSLVMVVLSVQTVQAGDNLRADVAIVFAVDTSASVNQSELEAMREAHREMLRDPRVQAAIASGRFGQIAVRYFEWAGSQYQVNETPWFIIGDDDSAHDFGLLISRSEQRAGDGDSNTAIGAALSFAAQLFDDLQHERTPIRASRWVVDIVGDGTSNTGPEPRAVAQALSSELGITINGLVVPHKGVTKNNHQSPPEGLPAYYRDNVMAGFGSFVEVAEGYDDFARALTAKFLTEIAAQ